MVLGVKYRLYSLIRMILIRTKTALNKNSPGTNRFGLSKFDCKAFWMRQCLGYTAPMDTIIQSFLVSVNICLPEQTSLEYNINIYCLRLYMELCLKIDSKHGLWTWFIKCYKVLCTLKYTKYISICKQMLASALWLCVSSIITSCISKLKPLCVGALKERKKEKNKLGEN